MSVGEPFVVVEFRCPACTKRYKVDEKYSGKKTKCKACDQPMEVPFPPLELPEEVTAGGSTVYRHEARMRDFKPTVGEGDNIEAIDAHITKHIGPVKSVWHELISDMVHVDIHFVAPSEKRPWNTLVTSGMSDLPMHCPPEVSQFAHAEVMVCLPPEWKLDEESLKDDRNYWPLYWLKSLARFPHEYETWLFEGHTIPNGDPAEPLFEGSGFVGWMLYWPVLADEKFYELKISAEKTIYFLAIYPLFQGEMDLKLKKGVETLAKRFDKYQVTELIDVDRKDSSKRRGWFS